MVVIEWLHAYEFKLYSYMYFKEKKKQSIDKYHTLHIHHVVYTRFLSQAQLYSGSSLIQTSLGQRKVSILMRCLDFRGPNEQAGCLIQPNVSIIQLP